MRAALEALFERRDGDLRGFYRELCVTGVEVLDVRGVSLSLMSDGQSNTLLASSDATAELVADLQFATGEGPSHDAYRAAAPILEPDLAEQASDRWPGFAPAVQELGIRSLFAWPLQIGAIRIGVLCLDGDRPKILTATELVDALALADAALDTVLTQLSDAPSNDGWLNEVGDPTNVVHQATGMVLAQLDTTAENALLRLRSHAFATGRTVALVAADVVARRLSFRDTE